MTQHHEDGCAICELNRRHEVQAARTFFVANYLDGDDGGTIQATARSLANEVAEIMVDWANDS